MQLIWRNDDGRHIDLVVVDGVPGIYNYSNEGKSVGMQFRQSGDGCEVTGIPSSSYPLLQNDLPFLYWIKG
jgi:hypothetical protein